MSWTEKAACRDAPTEVFFHQVPGAGARLADEEAKAWCRDCPVLAECRAHVDEVEDWYRPEGIFAGETPRERDQRRRRVTARTPIDHGTSRGYQQHRRRGVEPCPACREAHALDCRERTARRRGAA